MDQRQTIQQQTIERWERCEAVRAAKRAEALAAGTDERTPEKEAHKEAKAVWNGWAEEMLAKRKALEDADRWHAEINKKGELVGKNEATRKWLADAEVDFSDVHFLYQSTVGDTVRWDSFIFPDVANFDGFIFPGNTYFDGVQFPGDARFEGACFREFACFKNSHFKGGARFRGAHFKGIVRFDGTCFNGNARFEGNEKHGIEGAEFEQDARFDHVRFKGHALFAQVIFYEKATFMQAEFYKYADFEKTHFYKQVDFRAIRGERGFSLANAAFELVPDFIQAHFDEAPRLDNIRVPARARNTDPPATYLEEITQTPLSWFIRFKNGVKRRVWNADKDAPARFRELKRLAIQSHDSDREHEFFAREIRFSRFATDSPLPWRGGFWRFLFGYAYQCFGGLGTSVVRPLLWLLATMLIAAAFFLGENETIASKRAKLEAEGAAWPYAYAQTTYAAWLDRENTRCFERPPPASNERNTDRHGGLVKAVRDKTNAPFEALQLAFRNAFIVLDNGSDAAHRSYGCLYGVELYGGSTPVAVVPGTVSTAAAIQKVFSALFLFLFGLALRNMLKMK